MDVIYLFWYVEGHIYAIVSMAQGVFNEDFKIETNKWEIEKSKLLIN
jgi:hypothetical protein